MLVGTRQVKRPFIVFQIRNVATHVEHSAVELVEPRVLGLLEDLTNQFFFFAVLAGHKHFFLVVLVGVLVEVGDCVLLGHLVPLAQLVKPGMVSRVHFDAGAVVGIEAFPIEFTYCRSLNGQDVASITLEVLRALAPQTQLDGLVTLVAQKNVFQALLAPVAQLLQFQPSAEVDDTNEVD